ncbi:MAG: hypothetical protein O2904_02905 [bacterium]|nr:hypothetical protein [bacterium]
MSDDSVTAKDPLADLHPELQKMIPAKEVIYDAIMGKIEPELLSSNLSALTEKYKDESAEDRKARMQKYKAAFTAYDKAFQEWIAKLGDAVTEERKDAFEKAELGSREEDAGQMSNLESAFETADPPSHS